MFLKKLLLIIAISLIVKVNAQQTLHITCVDSATHLPIKNATISIESKAIKSSNSNGLAQVTLENGLHIISVSYIGYFSKSIEIKIPTTNTSIELLLTPEQKNLDDVVVVSSTRNNQSIENAPIKVEVLGKEEMTEESTIKPGNIASILGDVSGIQIQQSSATSGNANVRIQGLDGRYTQILKDGLPLFDGFSGGFGILSIPPLDLKQIELIKGSASTLYGGGAIGGLINIITKKPVSIPENTIIINQTTLKETNINGFFSKKLKHFGYTMFTGFTNQEPFDVNNDGFSDVSKNKSLIFHPRLFFYINTNATITTGYTGTFEDRNGGDMFVINNKADATHQFFEQNKTNRHSVELLFEQKLNNGKKFEIKSSLSSFNRSIITNTNYFKGNQTNYYSEASLFIPQNKNSTVIGVNYLGDEFKKSVESNIIPLSNFSNKTIGFFAQQTFNILDNTIVDVGLRNDYHTNYGNFILPRIALFHRFNKHWASRAGIGFGYKTPNALSPQNTDFKIENIQPVSSNVIAEKSIGYNAEINYKVHWDETDELFINLAYFQTNIQHPIIANEDINGNVNFSNASKPIVTSGFDIYAKAVLDEWELYVGYTYTNATRKYLNQNQFIPLTPRHRMAFTLVKEFEPKCRIGFEGSFTGIQFRNDGSKTPSYFFAAAMIEYKFTKHCSMVLNGENLFNYKQSNIESLFTGTITNPSFQPLWAPIDGRVINLSIKVNW
jgi:outer membrane receptor for ferrienterochelin and colicins